MSRQYPIWNEIQACIYKNDKSFGAKNVSECEILVGSGKSNSHCLAHIKTTRHEYPKRIVFKFWLDNQVVREKAFANVNGRAGHREAEIEYPTKEVITINTNKDGNS